MRKISFALLARQTQGSSAPQKVGQMEEKKRSERPSLNADYGKGTQLRKMLVDTGARIAPQREPSSINLRVKVSMNSHKAVAAPTDRPDLIDKKELCRRLGLPSVRMVEILMRKRKIPYIRLGHRTVRFSWQHVIEAVSRLEYRAASE